jgi:hypothetical protein
MNTKATNIVQGDVARIRLILQSMDLMVGKEKEKNEKAYCVL